MGRSARSTLMNRIANSRAQARVRLRRNITFANWRGVLAPPGISDAARESMIKVLEDLHSTQGWKDAIVKNGWTDAFMTGEAFEEFLVEQDNRVSTTLTELGLL